MVIARRVCAGARNDDGFSEAGICEQLGPLLSSEQRIRTAQIGVDEFPPTFGQSERQVDPSLRSNSFEDQELTAWREQRVNMLEGASHIRGRVQHIRGDNEVE